MATLGPWLTKGCTAQAIHPHHCDRALVGIQGSGRSNGLAGSDFGWVTIAAREASTALLGNEKHA